MDSFILEVLLTRGWRRGGEVFWTLEDAIKTGNQLIKRRLARRVRVLKVAVALTPVVELPKLDVVSAAGAQP